MLLKAYANWAQREVQKYKPHRLVRRWIKQWERTLNAMRASGPYEHTAIIVARWEFLGGLYLGSGKTDVKHARRWAHKFLHPIRPKYAPIHNLSGKPKGQRSSSEFFAVFRNKALHGYTPAAVHTKTNGVVGWWISSRPHLGRTTRGSVCISSTLLQRDFLLALRGFATYLEEDMRGPIKGKRPTELWRRSFWMRFAPLNYPESSWEAEGIRRGLFT